MEGGEEEEVDGNFFQERWKGSMRPKGYKGLALHGGPPGWLEESDPVGVISYVMDGPYNLPFSYRTGCP
jgi:hypothetical protein